MYFVEKFSATEEGLKKTPSATDPHAGMNIDVHQTKNSAIEKKTVEVKKVEGAISLAELFENKEKYKGQKVIVTGQVTNSDV